MKGSIKKLQEGKYRVVVDIGRSPEDKKRKQKTKVVWGTERDAEKALAKIILDAEKLLAEVTCRQSPEHKRTQELTVGEYLEEWYDATSHDLRKNTKIFYRRLISHIKETDIVSIPLVEVRPSDVQKAANQLPERLSASIRRRSCEFLRSAFRYALDWDMIEKDPFRRVKLPKVPKQERPCWTEKEAAMFLAAIKKDRYYTAFYVSLATGLRIGELLALTWDDVDIMKSVVSVSKTLLDTKGGIPVFGPTKNDESNRRVFLDQSTVEVLKAHRTAQLVQRLQTKKWQDHNLVFANIKGGAGSYCLYSKTLHRLARRSNIFEVNIHALRHSHATFLLNQGVPEIVIADRLGHTVDNKKTMLGMTAHYTHVTDNMRIEAAKAFTRALQKGYMECSGQVGHCM